MNIHHAIVVASLVALGGCSSPDNATACRDYVDYSNGLSCASATTKQDAGVCESFADAGCDISGYFECLQANTSCTTVGDTQLPNAQAAADACQAKNACP